MNLDSVLFHQAYCMIPQCAMWYPNAKGTHPPRDEGKSAEHKFSARITHEVTVNWNNDVYEQISPFIPYKLRGRRNIQSISGI